MAKFERLYNKKVIKSGDRLEIYNYNCYLREGMDGHNEGGRGGTTGEGAATEEAKEENRKKTLYRARNNIVRLISCNSDLQVFITLTYAEIPGELKESREHLNIFFKRLRRQHKDLKYLWVMEYGSLNKRLHFHLLMNINLSIKTAKSNELKSQEQKELEKLWNKKYWPHGWVDIRNLKEEGNTNIAKYVSAYLVEDLMELKLNGYRVYDYSRKLEKPIVSKLDTKDKLEDLTQLEGYKIQFVNTYKIKYMDKTGKDRESQVQYLDYVKK